MLAADIRISSAGAKFGLPETHWGILPSGGGAMKLISQIGYARAMQLLLTAELVSADEALSYGLLNSVLPPTDVLEYALKNARIIAANSPLAVRETKASAVHHLSILWKSLEAAERVRVKNVRESPDRLIGSDAFLGKRQPQYPA
jgi:enoyl-CoA hydratase/carnithine racemase